MRQVRLSPVVTVIGEGAPALAADLGRRRRGLLRSRRSTCPRRLNRTFELGGPDQVNWNELYLRIAATLGKRRRLVHVPAGVARAPAPGSRSEFPARRSRVDQVTMLEGPDNVVSDTDAVETFGLPLVPLDEQLRRAPREHLRQQQPRVADRARTQRAADPPPRPRRSRAARRCGTGCRPRRRSGGPCTLRAYSIANASSPRPSRNSVLRSAFAGAGERAEATVETAPEREAARGAGATS